MGLVCQGFPGRQAAGTVWERNFLRGPGFALLLALLSWVSVTGCAGVVSSSTAATPGKGQLSINPSTVPFGNVSTGSTGTQTITLSNTGSASLTVSQTSVSGPGFSISGPTFPLTLASGQSSTLTAKFAPTVAGAASGTISLVSNGSNSPTVVALTGTGTGASSSSQLSVSPTSASFAVNVGSSQSQPVTVTNTGTATLSITQANVSGSGFSVSGIALPLNLPPSQSSGFKVNFAPTAAGSVTGSVSLVSNPSSSPTLIALTGNGVRPPSAGVTGVTISPTNPSVQAGQTIQFTAAVQGTAADKSVKWTTSAGSINASGLFTAPSSAGTATVTATSSAPAKKQASSAGTVTAPPSPSVTGVTISPTNPSVQTSHTVQFTATVQGSATDKSVKWTASAGSIDASGLFTAASAAGTATVTATSNADTSKQASTTVTVPPAPGGPLAAFPGAEGGGAGSVGGRGGAVYEVTNLNDSGSGSLRACAEASGPRTCVFRVGGTIQLLSQISISNPYITIAGQTAPGGGILFSGTQMPAGTMLFIGTHDVVLRYIRTRVGVGPGHSGGPSNGVAGIAMMNAPVYNVVIDHVSESWWDNKPFIIYTNYPAGTIHNVTVQWTMNNEGLAPNASRPGSQSVCGGSGAFSSALINAAFTDIDYHHNFFSDCSHRNLETAQVTMHEVNDIHYNWSFFATQYGGSQSSDVIGNKYKAGPATGAPYMCNGNPCEILILPYNGATTASTPSVYLFGNVGPNQPNPLGNQWQMVQQETCYQCGPAGPVPSSWQRVTPLPAQQFPISADSVNNIENVVLPTVGDSQSLDCNGNWAANRDSVDVRLITQYQNNAGGIISDPSQVGGFPTIAAGTPCTSSLHDGIADAWKVKYGLSTTNTTLHQTTDPASGYTYLEDYLNGIVPKLTARTNSTTSFWTASLLRTSTLGELNVGLHETTKKRGIFLLPLAELFRHRRERDALAIARFASSSLDPR